MSWFNIALGVLGGLCAVFGIYWAWREDYISWSDITELFSLAEVKDRVLEMFTSPAFVILYLLFVFLPIWVIPDFFHVKAPLTLPLYLRIIVSLIGIVIVDRIAAKIE